MRKTLVIASLLLSFGLIAQNQSAAHILHQIHQMQNPLRVLYLAAHPDDENTRMISWLANDIGAQTAYLSLTRGDGGQNLIGTELGAQLGVLRTQELMQARAIDGGSQFFSRAVDFGYSKNPKETFEHWDRDLVLDDVVRVIRTYKPQIIITRFPPDGRGGHGHHTVSAMLALEAFEVAADPQKYPEQNLEPWQVSRIFWNHSSWWEPKIDSLAAADPSYFVVDVGTYLPELGLSCNELASYSRSQHKSQGFGVSVARGGQKEYLKLMKGEVDGTSIFSGLSQSWKQANQQDIAEGLAKIEEDFDPRQPHLSVESIIDLQKMIAQKRDADLEWLLEDLSRLAAACLGLKLEILAPEEYATPGEELKLEARAIHRSPLAVEVEHPQYSWLKPYSSRMEWMPLASNELVKVEFEVEVPENRSSQPYWLKESYNGMFQVDDPLLIGKAENDPVMESGVSVKVGEQSFRMRVPVRYKFSDRVEGEIERPLMVVPEITVNSRVSKLFFLDTEAQDLELDFRAFKSGSYKIQLVTEGWQVEPAEFVLEFDSKDQLKSQLVKISPKMGAAPGSLSILSVHQGEGRGNGSLDAVNLIPKLVEIDYSHIDKRMILEDPAIRLIPMNLKRKGSRVAYIVGAGDKVPEAIAQMGYAVDILDESTLRENDLQRYQAIVLGIRAFNTQSWLFDRKEQLMDYVNKGGNLIVQYNTRSRSFQGEDIAPYPFTISRERVTEEDAPVRFALPDHPVLNRPNQLIEAHFANWVQERGLYFASKWDDAYAAPLAWHDEGEPDRLGGLIIADYGKGAFIYTGISFFRELPAGVSGAYKLMANLISYEHE